MSSTPRSDPRRAAPDTTAWQPDAWDASPVGPAHTRGDLGTADDFVAGWDVVSASGGPSVATDALAALDALLPEFGRTPHGAGGHARNDEAAHAADARVAAVRAELAAAYAAELDTREAAYAAALDEAWREGYAAGAAAGEAAAQEVVDGIARTFDAAVHEVRTHEERWMGDLRAHVAALAVAVAHHVVGRAVAADDALVVALATRAVAEFPIGEALVARVHPDDLEALKAAWGGVARDGSIRWTPDARVARGGALVEGRERIVDGRVDAALERLYRALAGHAA